MFGVKKAFDYSIHSEKEFSRSCIYLKKQLKEWGSLHRQSSVQDICSLVNREKIYKIFSVMTAMKNYLDTTTKPISTAQSLPAQKLIKHMKGKLGTLYEAVISDTVNEAARWNQRVVGSLHKSELDTLYKLYPKMRRRLIDEQLELALLCCNGSHGRRKFRLSAKNPPIQVVTILADTEAILHRKWAFFG